MCKCDPRIKTPFCGKGDCQYPQTMQPNKIYKIEEEPNLLSALQSDLADILADSVKATKALHNVNDRAFDLMRKVIAIKKSDDQTKKDADQAGKTFHTTARA
jgi:hypothetical protein